MPVEQWQQEQNAKQEKKEAQKDAQRRMDHGTLNNHHERMLQNDKEGYLDMYARKELDRDNPHTAIAHSFLKPVIDEELKAILNNGGPELIEHIQKGGRIHEDILSKFSESIRKSYIQAKLLERDTLLEGIKNLDKQNATPYEVQQRAEMEESIARIDMRLGLLNSITPDYETVQALQKRNTPEIIHKQTYSPEQKPYDKPFSFLRPAYWGGHQKRLRKMALIDVERGKNPEGTYTPTELDRVRLTSVQQARNEKREKVAVGTDDPRPDPLFGADPAEPGTPPTGGTGPQPQGPDTPHTPNTDLDDPFAPNMARSTHSDFADTEPMVFDDEREQPIRPSSPENSQDRAVRVSKILDSLTKHLSVKGKWDWRYFAGAVIAGAGLSLATSSRANERGNQERPRTIQEVIMNAPSWREEFVRLDQNHASLLASFNPLKPISFDDLLTEYLENMSLTNPATKDKIANLAIMKVLNERGAGAGLNDEEQQEVSYLVSALMRARYFADHYKNLNARTINTIIGPQDYGEYDYTSVTLRDLYDMAMKAIAEGDRAYEVRTGKKTT
jgi:hypothetical protein